MLRFGPSLSDLRLRRSSISQQEDNQRQQKSAMGSIPETMISRLTEKVVQAANSSSRLAELPAWDKRTVLITSILGHRGKKASRGGFSGPSLIVRLT